MLRPVLALALLGACGAPPDDARADTPVEDAAAADLAPPRPATVDRSTFVEGQPQTEVLRLARVDAFPTPFSVYLRPGVTYTPPVDGEPVRFVAGTPPAHGEVTVRAAPGQSPAALAAAARAEHPSAFPLDDYAWADESLGYTDGAHGGIVHIARHDGAVFVVETHAPLEGGDGFAPTVQTILDTWRWADGSALR